MLPILSCFKKTPCQILAIISTILATNSYFFIERKSTNTFPLIFENITLHYIIYIICVLITSIVLYFFYKKSTFSQFLYQILVVFLPMEIVLIFGLFILHTETTAHYIFSLFTGTYLICAALYFVEHVFTFSHSQKKYTKTIIHWVKDQGKIYIFLLAISLSLFGYFGILHIGNYAGVDEPLWTFDRIPSFWKNVAQRDWSNTSISDKPGITVVLISGIGLLHTDPFVYEKLTHFDTETDVRDMNSAFRLPLVIFCLFSLFFFYIIIQELLNKDIALLSTALISTSPMLIGMSRIINPDAILWVFIPLTILAYIISLQKKTRLWLYMSGILLGLSLLTKYVANILYIFFFALIFIDYLFTHKTLTDKVSIHTYLKNSFIHFLSVVLISLITFYVLFPETWVDPTKLFAGTILSQAFVSIAPLFIVILIFLFIDTIFFRNKIITPLLSYIKEKRNILIVSIIMIFASFIIFTFLNTYLSMYFVNFQEILTSPKTSYKTSSLLAIFSTNFYPLIFTSFPIVILGVFFALVSVYTNHQEKTQNTKTITYFILFILIYYVGTTFNGVVSIIRYQVVLYPLLFIIAAIGFYTCITKWISYVKKNILLLGCVTLIMFIGIITLFTTKPFYLGYVSTLLPNKYIVDTKDMGDGSYEAAVFLNALPNAQDLYVWTDKKGLCAFFVGTCDSFYDREAFEKNSIDYFVLSSGRESKFTAVTGNRPHIPYDFQKMYNTSNTEFSLFIGNRPGNYIKILSAKKFSK